MVKSLDHVKKSQKIVFSILALFFCSSLVCLLETDSLLSQDLTFRRIKSLIPPTDPRFSRLTIGFKELRRTKEDVLLVGGKGASLGELSQLQGIEVPEGFVVTTTAFHKFLDANPGLKDNIDKFILAIDWNNPTSLREASEKIKQEILKADIPEEIVKAVTEDYRRLEEFAKVKDLPTAVRSSAVAEDSPNFSWAGQFRTVLNQRGIFQVLEAIHANWADLYNPDALAYGHQNEIDPRKFAMGVIVQRMVNSEQSGVGFGLESDTGFRAAPGIVNGVFYIEGVYGLGEALVQNLQEPDGFVVVKTLDNQYKIVERTFGSKQEQIVYRPGMGGTEQRPVPEELRAKWVLKPEEVLAIARTIEIINNHYGAPQDVEFAREGGKLYIVQARNETRYSPKPLDLIEWKKKVVDSNARETAKVMARGEGVGAKGAGVGKVVVIDEKSVVPIRQQAEGVKEGDVLVAYRTDPSLVDAMRRASLIVTEIGGKNCHAAIVSREYNLNAVIGVKGAMGIFAEGQVVTVDAEQGVIYAGELPLKESNVSYQVSNLPQTQKIKVGTLAFDTARVRAMFALGLHPSYYGIGLMRAEFALQNIGIHPLAILDYDAKKLTNPQVSQDITAKIKGYDSAKAYYLERLSSAIYSNSIVMANGQKVIYRTTDFKSNEYEDMLGGDLYEHPETNPMMGDRGLQRMLSTKYKEAFEMELEAFLKAWAENPDKISIMVPVVRTPQDIAVFKQILQSKIQKMGLSSKGMPEIVMMYEVPANVFQAADFMQQGIKGISIGSNDLTQFILGVDRDSGLFKGQGMEEYDAVNPAVIKGLGIGIKTAQRFGVKSGICGQAPSDHPDVYPYILTALGIDSISVTPDVFHKVVGNVAKAEREGGGERYLAGLDLFLDYVEGATPSNLQFRTVSSDGIVKPLGIHPLAMLAFDRGKLKGHPEVVRDIAAIVGTRSAEKVYWDTVYRATQAALKLGSNVNYKTAGLLSTEYTKLIGGSLYEKPEANPILGAFGAYRMLQYGSEDGSLKMKDIFLMEMTAVLQAAKDAGKTISLELDMVRTLTELKDAMGVINEAIAKVDIDKNKIKLGISVSTPGNVLLIDRFIREGNLSFVRVNQERLAQYLLAADPLAIVEPARVRAALEIPLKIINTALKRANVNLGIPNP
jgi:pyruvate,water dikinase